DSARLRRKGHHYHVLGGSPREDRSTGIFRFSSTAGLPARLARWRNRAYRRRSENQTARRARAGDSGSHRDQRRKSRAISRSDRNGAAFRQRESKRNPDCGKRTTINDKHSTSNR